MVNVNDPFTYENSSNPWIMDKKDIDKVVQINGNKITAEYLWTLNKEERIQCLNDVFNYYRAAGFPYEELSEEYIKKSFDSLKKYNINNVINSEGYISNSGTLCLDLCRYFCKDIFWKAAGEVMPSIEDVFYNDEQFIKVLKNRMGWNTTSEGASDGEERPYMFGITDKVIRDGIRNSGFGYGVSNFRPAIAKFIYKKYLDNLDHTPVVFDYSGGWSARAMAAASLGYDYYGVDPLTADDINKCGEYLKDRCGVTSIVKCFKSGSEDPTYYKEIPMVDMCMSCPPYFTLEVYSKEETQSYNKFDEFSNWINMYWKPTVENCLSILKDNGYFVLIIKDQYGKYTLKNSMESVILEHNMELIDTYQYKTAVNHLSGKVKTGRTTKNSEYVLVYRKK